jgi:hypothetical protein
MPTKKEKFDYLEKAYPELVSMVKKEDPNSMFHWSYLQRYAKDPVKEMEKYVVYKTLTAEGPDYPAQKIGRHLPKIRRAVGGSILDAYLNGTLVDALDELGWFGPKSDTLRGEDRFYAANLQSTRRRRQRIATMEEEVERLYNQERSVEEEIDRLSDPAVQKLVTALRTVDRDSTKIRTLISDLRGVPEEVMANYPSIKPNLLDMIAALKNAAASMAVTYQRLESKWSVMSDIEDAQDDLLEQMDLIKQTPEAVDYLKSTDEY